MVDCFIQMYNERPGGDVRAEHAPRLFWATLISAAAAAARPIYPIPNVNDNTRIVHVVRPSANRIFNDAESIRNSRVRRYFGTIAIRVGFWFEIYIFVTHCSDPFF